MLSLVLRVFVDTAPYPIRPKTTIFQVRVPKPALSILFVLYRKCFCSHFALTATVAVVQSISVHLSIQSEILQLLVCKLKAAAGELDNCSQSSLQDAFALSLAVYETLIRRIFALSASTREQALADSGGIHVHY